MEKDRSPFFYHGLRGVFLITMCGFFTKEIPEGNSLCNFPNIVSLKVEGKLDLKKIRIQL